jgi:hypothetical protein
MIKQFTLCLTAICLVVIGITTATPTADALGVAPWNEGNAITDTAAIVSTWQSNGYSPASLTTSSATRSAILDYWQNDQYLLWNNHIGHIDTADHDGAPAYGVFAYNQEISAVQIAELDPWKGLASSYVFMNGCNSYAEPLNSAFQANNVDMYIGGVKILPLYSSEDTSKDFWHYLLVHDQDPIDALVSAVSDNGTGGMYSIMLDD